MPRVSVVGTRHREAGAATSAALLVLLERIAPEVIFIESPPDAVTAYMNAAHSCLEPEAIRRYATERSVDIVPVDAPTPAATFFSDHKELVDEVEHRSPDFCRLTDWNSDYSRRHGFHYLNSAHQDRLQSERRDAEWATVREIDERGRLARILGEWDRVNALRERAMIANIRRYCALHEFGVGALLVGAAHRASLIDRSKEFTDTGTSRISWDFGEFLLEAPWGME